MVMLTRYVVTEKFLIKLIINIFQKLNKIKSQLKLIHFIFYLEEYKYFSKYFLFEVLKKFGLFDKFGLKNKYES